MIAFTKLAKPTIKTSKHMPADVALFWLQNESIFFKWVSKTFTDTDTQIDDLFVYVNIVRLHTKLCTLHVFHETER